MNYFRCFFLLGVFALFQGGDFALADPITFFNTGVAADGSVLAAGSTDSNYNLIYSSDGGTYTATAETPNGVWTAPSNTAGWISPGASGNQAWNSGYYIYEATLNLNGYYTGTASLSGMIAADNAVSIYLNRSGPAVFTDTAGFASLTPFLINSGFVDGVNLIDFVVYNQDGPTGLMVDNVTANAETPEPGSWLLLGTGLVVAGAFQVGRRARLVTG